MNPGISAKTLQCRIVINILNCMNSQTSSDDTTNIVTLSGGALYAAAFRDGAVIFGLLAG